MVNSDEELSKQLNYYSENLNTLGKIKINNKLAIDNNNFYLQDSNTQYLLSIRRWWYGFSRNNTIDLLDKFYTDLFNLVDNLLEKYKNSKDKNKMINREHILAIFEKIKYSKRSFTILRMIYKSDSIFIDKLNGIFKKVSEKCRNLTQIIYLDEK